MTSDLDRDPPDVARLLGDWERMSAHYLPGRAELLATAIGWLGERDPVPAVVELGAGPGTTLRALRRALPTASLVGVDSDPVLRAVHRMATPDSHAIRLVDADLSDRSWRAALPDVTSATAVVALQVLHYFPPARFAEILGEIHDLLEPGGALVHIDVVPPSPQVDETQPSPHGESSGHVAGEEPWSSWWSAASLTPSLADAFEARAARSDHATGSAEYHPDQDELERHLRTAGFDLTLQARHDRSLLTIASATESPSDVDHPGLRSRLPTGPNA